MNVGIPEEELVGVVEVLNFVVELCSCEGRRISAALARFVGHTGWDALELRSEALCYADRLAQAMGFPDADMDPTKRWPRVREA